MELLPIKKTREENQAWMAHPDYQNTINQTIDFYEKVGFYPPWIGYYAQVAGRLVGSGGFKGRPQAGKVEIAYGTFPSCRHQGIGTQICRQLVLLSLQTDPGVRITARTLPENKESASILKKNGFECLGTIWDDEDGNVWEWELFKSNAPAKTDSEPLQPMG